MPGHLERKRSFSSFLLASGLLGCLMLTPCSGKANKPTKLGTTVQDKKAPSGQEEKIEGLATLLPEDSVTQGHISLHGKTMSYAAHAGTLPLRGEKGQVVAKMFYVAYTKKSPSAAGRPVTFFFNGGPGAGSAYLNLGAAGPVVLNFPTGNPTDGASAWLGPNPDSWLDATDMVFIDAVGTGYSLPVQPKDAARDFYGTSKDARSFAKAIALWLHANGRAMSPLYLAGESYGGVRAIEVATALAQQQSILLKGIIMISPAIEMSLLFDRNSPVLSAMTLPSLIATELDRKRQLTPKALDDAYHFAFGPYINFLLKPLSEQEEAAPAFYKQLSEKTGISEEIIAKQRGQLDPQAHDIRSRKGRLYSLYDATLSVEDPYPEGVENSDSPDPVLSGFGQAYGNAFTHYASSTLGFKTELTYQLLNMQVNNQWDFKGEDGTPIASEIPKLRKLLALNPTLRVFIANGIYDLVCPFGMTRWFVEHMPVGRSRITRKVYPGGHMLYTSPQNRANLHRDISIFYDVPSVHH